MKDSAVHKKLRQGVNRDLNPRDRKRAKDY